MRTFFIPLFVYFFLLSNCLQAQLHWVDISYLDIYASAEHMSKVDDGFIMVGTDGLALAGLCIKYDNFGDIVWYKRHNETFNGVVVAFDAVAVDSNYIIAMIEASSEYKSLIYKLDEKGNSVDTMEFELESINEIDVNSIGELLVLSFCVVEDLFILRKFDKRGDLLWKVNLQKGILKGLDGNGYINKDDAFIVTIQNNENEYELIRYEVDIYGNISEYIIPIDNPRINVEYAIKSYRNDDDIITYSWVDEFQKPILNSYDINNLEIIKSFHMIDYLGVVMDFEYHNGRYYVLGRSSSGSSNPSNSLLVFDQSLNLIHSADLDQTASTSYSYKLFELNVDEAGNLLMSGAIYANSISSGYINMYLNEFGELETLTTKYIDTSIEVYPNPTSDFVFIKNPTNKIHIEGLYNSNGQKLNVPINFNSIDLSKLHTGMYYLKLKGENGYKIEPIFKK